MRHDELTIPVICERHYFAQGFFVEERRDGFYAVQCDEDKNTPLTASAIGPCVSKKQAAFLYVRKFCR